MLFRNDEASLRLDIARYEFPDVDPVSYTHLDVYKRQELRKLLSGHLCRCTGYENILRAVKKTMYKRLGKPMPEA